MKKYNINQLKNIDFVKRQIKLFVLNNLKFQNFNIELFLNSFSIYYLHLKQIGNTGGKEYKALDNLFKKELKVVPKLNTKGNIEFEELINTEPLIKNNKIKNVKNSNFFKKRYKNNNNNYKELSEKSFIKDIFWNMENEIGDLILLFLE